MKHQWFDFKILLYSVFLVLRSKDLMLFLAFVLRLVPHSQALVPCHPMLTLS
jgi:hypothetical protein